MNKSYWWPASFIVLGIILVTGVLNLIAQPPRGDPIQLVGPPTPAPLIIFVSGAVNSPGLVSLPPGSRLNDAIQAVGGLRDDADASMLNLARVLEDGEQVDVPVINISPPDGEITRSNPSSFLININTATIEQLDTLPDIGPKLSQAIIDYRVSNGPFESIEEIMEVDDIGQVTFDKIKDLISVGSSNP